MAAIYFLKRGEQDISRSSSPNMVNLCIQWHCALRVRYHKEQRSAIMGDSTLTPTISDTSREKSASPTSPEVTRTQTTSSKQIRGVRPNILNSKNMIPNYLPSTLLTIKGVEQYVSESLSDPSIHIHTVTIFESEN